MSEEVKMIITGVGVLAVLAPLIAVSISAYRKMRQAR